jgi:hypothetical protein
MIPQVHISVRLALLQLGVVMLGVFMTRAAFMASGYPEAKALWNAFPLFVRNYGFVFLIIPLAWTGMVLWLENKSTGRWTSRWTFVSGLILLVALVLLFLWTYGNPYSFRKEPIQMIGD